MLDAILVPIGEGNRVLAQISGGKIDEVIAQTYQGDHEKMKLAVNNVATVLQGLQKELARLTEASREGRLGERGKPEAFKGAYADIVQGVNGMLDAILLPIGEGNRILGQISAGKIDELIAQTYKGDHEKMKLAINNVGAVVQSLQKELLRLTEASREGQLSERGRPDQFRGAYADIVSGVNAMLDAILLPIGEGNRILSQISAGKIDELIAQTYKGDHEKMKLAVNNVGTVVQSLQRELLRLTDAAKDGKLAERGNPEQFHGAYANIVRGVNAILDAVITPLNVAGNYVFASRTKDQELIHLIDAVRTNKTDFFREAEHFDYLASKALPSLEAQNGADRQRLVWSAGCSTGEEPYSLAMVLSEYAQSRPGFRFRVLATDISTEVLAKARTGTFNSEAVAPVPQNLRKKYLMRSRDPASDLVRVVPELRATIEFRRLNFMNADHGLSESPEIIFCRNVIIYFDRPTQVRILSKLVRQLAPGGYFFAGHSESLQNMDLPLVSTGAAVYRKRP